MTTKPDTLILRVPDEDGSKTFMSVPLGPEGQLLGTEAHAFQVMDGDTYNLLGFDQMVFAISSDGGESSIELARLTVAPKDENAEPIVCHEDPFQVALMVRDVLADWDSHMANASSEP